VFFHISSAVRFISGFRNATRSSSVLPVRQKVDHNPFSHLELSTPTRESVSPISPLLPPLLRHNIKTTC
jgi:hypothetical protein